MQKDLGVLDQIRREGSALYAELQTVKARLRLAEQSCEGPENAPEHEYGKQLPGQS